MRRLGAIILTIAASLTAAMSWAEPLEVGEIARGYVYYNKSGTSINEHNVDLTKCVSATNAQYIRSVAGRGGLFFAGAVTGQAAARVENCMLVRGWKAYQLEESQGRQLAELPEEQLASALAPMVGADAPPGKLVREWKNIGLFPNGVTRTSRPHSDFSQQLSTRVWNPGPNANVPLVPTPTGNVIKQLKGTTLPIPRQGMALVIVRTEGVTTNGGGLTFARVLPDDERGQPDVIHARVGVVFAKKDGNWFVFEVPVGTWRISELGVLDYCLGAPAFVVQSGEVVFAGSFDLDGPELGPQRDPNLARQCYAGPAAASIKEAQYQNGAQGPCLDYTTVYALEFPIVAPR